ncbi:hypothetical protein GCM10010885_21890 [Alicyclobacillus cellulosilyticus]|uniref:Helix-hairpin-helix DNA-binding motif class 1 domain-containing protein n=1 Tax=Alicyclobacillus cellulosilyticus TaxID=1003997 RepID=A0A917KHZ7_9BACL|nr:helix-hairpin-helix domain-containing protein [Alicyclobacillus cellulosilyticus]GGJ12106.1 hypothetical protein GCM10010885_21890 [Alicyclobacillus cellulosilyticus]
MQELENKAGGAAWVVTGVADEPLPAAAWDEATQDAAWPAPRQPDRQGHRRGRRWRGGLFAGLLVLASAVGGGASFLAMGLRGGMGSPAAGPASTGQRSTSMEARAADGGWPSVDAGGNGGMVAAATGSGSTGTGSSYEMAPDRAAGAVPSVVVDVHGDVRHPGVYRLPEGARVEDAVRAAGGYLHAADRELVNAAAPLDDGEEVVIPAPAARPPALPVQAGSAPLHADADTNSAAAAGRIDLNTADAATLETLPGVGPARAGAILAYRTSHGGFRAVTELLQVEGIGPVLYSRIAPHVFVAAPPAAAQAGLVPGDSARAPGTEAAGPGARAGR